METNIERLKVSSAEIIVRRTSNLKCDKQPYFEIKYKLIDDDNFYYGYGSYYLNRVFNWLDNEFEIIKKEVKYDYTNDV
jgi:hypothetical protein